jgi:predicted dienelactone hydrolase
MALPTKAWIGQNQLMRGFFLLKPIFAVLAVLVAIALPAQAEDRFKVGLTDILTTDGVDGVKMSGLVAYPTKEVGEPAQIAIFTVAGTRRPPIVPGRYPLIIFSHNAGGSRLDNHDSMTALTRAGFITAALEHPRDNYRDQTGFGTDRQLVGRSHHIKAFIDGILADPTIGPAVDRTRIGIVGFALGGYTALLTIGAKPNFARIADYAKAVPQDPVAKILTTPAAQRRRPGFEAVADPRVRAAYIMSPMLGFLFDQKGLADVRAPLRLYRAGKDEVLPEPYNIDNILKNLPAPPELAVAEGMGHFIFFSPCSQDLEVMVPWICRDAAGIDRVAFHEKLNADMVDFFQRTLDVH